MAQLIFSCSVQKTCLNCGVVLRKMRFLDSASGKYIGISQNKDMKMWYKDSMVIQEAHHIYQNEDEYHNITWSVVVEKYKFADLRTREIYEYYTFSDTSKLIKRCTPEDTGCTRETWVFWTEKHGFMPNDKPESMNDTLIGGVKYQRVRFTKKVDTEKGKVEYSIIGFLRCDLKNAILMYDKPFSKKMGCALVRFEDHYFPPVYPSDYGECEYLSQKLTQEELKVFNSWEKNAKTYKKHE